MQPDQQGLRVQQVPLAQQGHLDLKGPQALKVRRVLQEPPELLVFREQPVPQAPLVPLALRAQLAQLEYRDPKVTRELLVLRDRLVP